jgi:hypothetical protein
MQLDAQIGHEAGSFHYGGEDWRRAVLDPPHVQRRRLEVDPAPSAGPPRRRAAHAGRLKRSERIAAAVAIALDHLDELFELMLCQVFAGSQGGIRRPARCRMARNCSYLVVGVTSARYGFVIDLWAFRRATVQ